MNDFCDSKQLFQWKYGIDKAITSRSTNIKLNGQRQKKDENYKRLSIWANSKIESNIYSWTTCCAVYFMFFCKVFKTLRWRVCLCFTFCTLSMTVLLDHIISSWSQIDNNSVYLYFAITISTIVVSTYSIDLVKEENLHVRNMGTLLYVKIMSIECLIYEHPIM